MPLAMRPRVIQVERSNRGFGLSLIYRGLDKYEEKETGIFVARVVPGGQAARFGVKENDKIISINNKSPRNVDDAVNIIKEAGKSIRLMLVRQEEVPGKDDFWSIGYVCGLIMEELFGEEQEKNYHEKCEQDHGVGGSGGGGGGGRKDFK